MNRKLIRITTVPLALKYLLPGQMEFMTQNGYDVVMISADGKDREDIIKNEGCRHIIVPMTRKITPLQDLKCLWLLIKILKKEKPAIVHTHTPKAGLLGMLAAKFCGIKHRIHTVAGLPLMVERGTKLRVLKTIERITYAAASHVWPNSNSLKDFIIENKFTAPAKLKVISKGSTNGINTIRFNKHNLNNDLLNTVKQSIHYSQSDTYLLCIGRMVADKGIAELVNVFSTLNAQSSLKLILVGPFEKELDPLPEKTISEIETNPAIFHIHWSDNVEYYMAIADLFIFPSHREGFPNVLLQAGAMQLPVVCSNIPGNVDIVTNKKTGLIFERQNEEGLKSTLVYALNHLQECKNMAETLHQNILNFYDRQIVWKALLDEYNKLTATAKV